MLHAGTKYYNEKYPLKWHCARFDENWGNCFALLIFVKIIIIIIVVKNFAVAQHEYDFVWIVKVFESLHMRVFKTIQSSSALNNMLDSTAIHGIHSTKRLNFILCRRILSSLLRGDNLGRKLNRVEIPTITSCRDSESQLAKLITEPIKLSGNVIHMRLVKVKLENLVMCLSPCQYSYVHGWMSADSSFFKSVKNGTKWAAFLLLLLFY